MQGLILHVGAKAIERGRLDNIPLPERTQSFVPLPHISLLTHVERSLSEGGMRVIEEAHGLSEDGQKYFGLLRLASEGSPSDFSLVVGLRNSNDRTFPAALAVGASVFVCDNLSFSGEVKIARRHTVHIERDLPALVSRAVGQLGDLREGQTRRFDAYKQTELGDTQAHDLMIQAIDRQVIPVTKLPGVIEEWRNPRHPEFREGGKTAWRLFQAFTENLKTNLDALPRRTQALHGLVDLACGLGSQN